MDLETARALSQLNTDFYRRVSSSFSQTRQTPWRGWVRVRDLVRTELGASPRVLDVACGNLRFERYLAQTCPTMHAWAVDNCDELVRDGGPAVTYQHLDIATTLLDGQDLGSALSAPACDLSVCFGFLHHLALPAHRTAVLQTLVNHTRSGGYVVVSLWQFARDERILSKAQPLVDPGDYLLGWQDDHTARRYCHSFCDEEVDELVASASPHAREIERYWADGKRDDLNCYTILQVI